jgi:hypothetical protein
MTKTKFEVMDLCNAVEIPVGPILSMKEMDEAPALPGSDKVAHDGPVDRRHSHVVEAQIDILQAIFKESTSEGCMS